MSGHDVLMHKSFMVCLYLIPYEKRIGSGQHRIQSDLPSQVYPQDSGFSYWCILMPCQSLPD